MIAEYFPRSDHDQMLIEASPNYYPDKQVGSKFNIFAHSVGHLG